MNKKTDNRLLVSKILCYIVLLSILLSAFLYLKGQKKMYTGREEGSKVFLPKLDIEKVDEIIIENGDDFLGATLLKNKNVWITKEEGNQSRTADRKRVEGFLHLLKKAKIIEHVTKNPKFFKKFLMNRDKGGEITLKEAGKITGHFILGYNNMTANTAMVRRWGSKEVLKIDQAPYSFLEKKGWAEQKVFAIAQEDISEILLSFDKNKIGFRRIADEQSREFKWIMFLPEKKDVDQGKIYTLLIRISKLSTLVFPGKMLSEKKGLFTNSPLVIKVKSYSGREVNIRFGKVVEGRYIVRREEDKNTFFVEKHHFNAFRYPPDRYL